METLVLANTEFYRFQTLTVFIVVAGIVTLLGILIHVIHSMYRTRQIEQSRREIAAYIAEGSMSPEDGERMMNAGEGVKKCG